MNFEIAKKHFLNGLAHLKNDKFLEAECHFLKSLDIIPDRVSTLTNLSATQIKLKKFSDARIHSQKAISLDKSNSEAYLNLGLIYQEEKNFTSALEFFDLSLKLNPSYPEALSNQGATLNELKRYDEALASYDKAISLKPEYHEAWYNKGITLGELKRYDEALASYDKSISLKPDYSDAYWNQALSHLVTGNFESGWKNYEYRWKKTKAEPMRHQEFPLLTDLNEISGKNVLVWSEQGYGDTIQFSRFIEKLIELKADVIFEVQEPLKELLQNSFLRPKIISQEESTGVIDFQIPLVSLPLLFSTNFDNIPSTNSYIRADEENLIFWRDKLNSKNKKMNIGVACSGNKNHLNDKNRSMDLRFFEPIADKVNLFLIQKDLREKDQDFLSQYPDIKFLGEEIKSFNDSASIIQAMDLIITVDTSLAHLSGALGKRTFILLPWNPEWRWLLDRQDSPWYPTAKLFRQPSRDNWEEVIKEVILHLSLDDQV